MRALVGKAAKRKATSATVFNGREFMIDGAAQHDALHHFVFRNSEGLCLFGNLLFDERCFHKAGADDVGAHAMLGPSLAITFDRPMSPCFAVT